MQATADGWLRDAHKQDGELVKISNQCVWDLGNFIGVVTSRECGTYGGLLGAILCFFGNWGNGDAFDDYLWVSRCIERVQNMVQNQTVSKPEPGFPT